MGCGCSKPKKPTWQDKKIAAKIAALPKTEANNIVNGKGTCAKCGKVYPKKKLRAWGKQLWCIVCIKLQRMKAKKV